MLKASTAADHAAVDGAIMRGGYLDTAQGYRGLLGRLHAFHAGLEAHAPPLCRREMQRWSLTERSAWLALDLAALSAPILLPDPAWTAALPDLEGADAVLGLLYVLLGAALGARILVARVEGRGLACDGAGTAYLTGLSTSDHWQTYLAHLEAAEVADEQRIVAAARATFASLCRHFTPGPPP